MKSYDVVSVCNALVDILFEATDADLQRHELTKGSMHLVDQRRQRAIFQDFASRGAKAEELGGSAMNAIRALAMLGKKTCFAGMIADDVFGRKIKERLIDLGIDGQIHTTTAEATGVCMVLVTPDGERTMVTYLGASRLYDKEHIPYQMITKAHFFHFCGYQWDTEGQKDAIQSAITAAKSGETLVSFDLADPFVVRHHQQAFQDLIRHGADVVFANKEEAKLLYGQDIATTAQLIAEQGAIAVIKLGGEGALIRQGKQVFQVPAAPAKVVDTTGAGDMFAAGFLYGLTSAKSLADCGKVAATLASDVISRYGAQLSERAIAAVRAGY